MLTREAALTYDPVSENRLRLIRRDPYPSRMRAMLAATMLPATVLTACTGGGQQTTTETVTGIQTPQATAASTTTNATTPAPPPLQNQGAQWAETYEDSSLMFSVNNPQSGAPAIDPGEWGGTVRNPDPNKIVACAATQWAGDNRSDIIAVHANPIGEAKFLFRIEPAPGHVELVGDCDWSGGWDGPT